MTINDVSSTAHFEVKKVGAVETGSTSRTKAVLSWLLHQTSGGYWLRYIAFRAAFARAYTRFAHRHEDWVDCFFDEHFLSQTASPVLTRYLKSSPRPTPAELAALWVEQFPPDNSVKKYKAILTPVAADFLKLLETEMEGGFLLRKV
ncbi:MAG TPA: hypothetical protein VGD99_20630 [Anaerolineae bacterium]|jgi:hypothetical protein